MKELSEEELKIAPGWAVYFVADGNDILFLNKDKNVGQWLVEEFELECGFDLQEEFKVTCDQLSSFDEFHPLNGFDIINHEWSDCRNLKCIGKDKGLETVCFKVSVFNGLAFFDLDKDDAIAIAKHFDLTAEDLK